MTDKRPWVMLTLPQADFIAGLASVGNGCEFVPQHRVLALAVKHHQMAMQNVPYVAITPEELGLMISAQVQLLRRGSNEDGYLYSLTNEGLKVARLMRGVSIVNPAGYMVTVTANKVVAGYEFYLTQEDFKITDQLVPPGPPEVTTAPKVPLTAKYVQELLEALNGPGHLIRELQATRNLSKLMIGEKFINPIEALMDEYNAWIASRQ